ncbi:unnamed protein product [Amoebophrya sp. A25]|nr:unnamed protein product [Amoebophrya sp. A25]|eukprot:GSA25T00007631001.1
MPGGPGGRTEARAVPDRHAEIDKFFTELENGPPSSGIPTVRGAGRSARQESTLDALLEPTKRPPRTRAGVFESHSTTASKIPERSGFGSETAKKEEDAVLSSSFSTNPCRANTVSSQKIAADEDLSSSRDGDGESGDGDCQSLTAPSVFPLSTSREKLKQDQNGKDDEFLLEEKSIEEQETRNIKPKLVQNISNSSDKQRSYDKNSKRNQVARGSQDEAHISAVDGTTSAFSARGHQQECDGLEEEETQDDDQGNEWEEQDDDDPSFWSLTEDPAVTKNGPPGLEQVTAAQRQYALQIKAEYDKNLEVWRMLLVDFFRFRHKNPEKIKELVRRGLPECLRGAIWQRLAQSRELRQKHPLNLYETLKQKRNAPCEPDIRRDINRTFPKHVLYCDRQAMGQEQLLHVLRAYSLFNPEVGYCQGMGFIVGLLLCYLSEEDAFYMVVSLLENYRMSGLFKPNLPLLAKYFFQLNLLIKMHLPKLYEHFLLQNVEPTMYASQWFMTVCVYNFRFSTVCRVWDIFLAEGVKIIFRVALAILKLNADLLLSQGFEDILQVLKTAPSSLDTETLIQVALGIKLKASVLKELEAEFVKSGGAAGAGGPPNR